MKNSNTNYSKPSNLLLENEVRVFTVVFTENFTFFSVSQPEIIIIEEFGQTEAFIIELVAVVHYDFHISENQLYRRDNLSYSNVTDCLVDCLL